MRSVTGKRVATAREEECFRLYKNLLIKCYVINKVYYYIPPTTLLQPGSGVARLDQHPGQRGTPARKR